MIAKLLFRHELDLSLFARNRKLPNIFLIAFVMVLLMAAMIILPTSLVGAVPITGSFAPASGGTPLYAWGSNANGLLGQGTVGGDVTTPIRVGTADNWTQVATAAGGALALNADGEIYAWGANWNSSQMGQGGVQPPAAYLTGNSISRPARVGTANNWMFVSFSGMNALAINTDGHLYVWGNNSDGQIGDGTTINRNAPTRVGHGSDWVVADTSGGGANDATAAISADGYLYVWGHNSSGQLGQGTIGGSLQLTPLRVGTEDNWKVVSVGRGFVSAINTDGELFTWGTNGSGQLGRGEILTIAERATPMQVGSATNWIGVSPASNVPAVVALNSDGAIFTWGNTQLGALGRPVTTLSPNYLPGKVGDRTDWVAIGAGNSHIFAMTSGMELWAWGNNANGRLGIGVPSGYRPAPVFVLQTYGLAGFSQSGAGNHSMALIHTTPVVAEGYLEKRLEKPEGTPVPTTEFTFEFEAYSFNGDPALVSQVPNISDRVVPIGSGNISTTASGITTTRNSVNALEGVEFGSAGVFAWRITEVNAAPGIGSNSTVTFSQAEYEMRVHVTGIGDLEVLAVTVHRIRDAQGQPAIPPAEKVYELSFLNTYIRRTTGTNEYPGAFTVSKIVDGQFANPATLFDFDVTLTRTALCPPISSFVARVYNANSTFNRTVTIASGTSTHIQLTAGQRMVFGDPRFTPQGTLAVGTTFVVVERAMTEFTASVELYVDGDAVAIAPNTNPNQALSTGSHIVGAERNTAAFTNRHFVTPSAGLTLGNISFILPVLAATGLFLAYIASRRRKNIEELALDTTDVSL